MASSQLARNREIAYRVRIEGWSKAAVARAYRLSQSRIGQIVEDTDLFSLPDEPEIFRELRHKISFHVDRAAQLATELADELQKAQELRAELVDKLKEIGQGPTGKLMAAVVFTAITLVRIGLVDIGM